MERINPSDVYAPFNADPRYLVEIEATAMVG